MWVFFSDVHLDAPGEARADARRAAFHRFLDRLEALRNEGCELHLYCLGDLVEFWLEGDKYDLGDRTPDLARLRPFAVRFLPGNRDFLAGPRFAALTGCEILPDEFRLEVGRARFHLLHGDLLCSADWRYQLWRMGSRGMSRAFRRLPRGAAEAIAARMRKISADEIKRKGPKAHAVDDDAVRRRLAGGATHVVAGHTHRPEVRTYPEGTLFVLGEWDDPEAEILVVREDGRTYFGAWPSLLSSPSVFDL